jgi:hypothetical protein
LSEPEVTRTTSTITALVTIHPDGDRPLVALEIFQFWADAVDFRNSSESIFDTPKNKE